ncbi:hypothetical protein VTI74DRAFT_3600 [Chaetomium olivicolor]
MSARRKSRSCHDDQPQKRRRSTAAEVYDHNGGQHTGSGPLACHFYKRFPTHFTRCLFRNHLTSTSFVVQHIHRCHSQPIRCPICSRAFDGAAERDEHIRQRTCQSASRDPGCVDNGREGLDRHQLVELRQRTSRRGLTEAERWYAIWDFIFPGAPRPDSPYIRSPEDEILGITRQAIQIVCPGGNSPELLNLMNWSTVSSAFEKTSPYPSSNRTPSEPDSVSSPGPPTPPEIPHWGWHYSSLLPSELLVVPRGVPDLNSDLWNTGVDNLLTVQPDGVDCPDCCVSGHRTNFDGMEEDGPTDDTVCGLHWCDSSFFAGLAVLDPPQYKYFDL